MCGCVSSKCADDTMAKEPRTPACRCAAVPLVQVLHDTTTSKLLYKSIKKVELANSPTMLIVSAPGQAGDCQSKEPLPVLPGNTTAEPPPSIQVPEEQEAPDDVLNMTAAAESPLQVAPAQVQNSESCASSSQSAESTPEKQQLSQSDGLDMPEAAANEVLEKKQAEKTADVVTAVGVNHQDADHPGLHGDPVCVVAKDDPACLSEPVLTSSNSSLLCTAKRHSTRAGKLRLLRKKKKMYIRQLPVIQSSSAHVLHDDLQLEGAQAEPGLSERETLFETQAGETEYKTLLAEAKDKSWHVFDKEGLLLGLKDCRDHIKVLEAIEARGAAAEDKLRAVLQSWSGEVPAHMKSQRPQLKQQLRDMIESTKRAAMAEIARCAEEQKLLALQQQQLGSAVDTYESLAVPYWMSTDGSYEHSCMYLQAWEEAAYHHIRSLPLDQHSLVRSKFDNRIRSIKAFGNMQVRVEGYATLTQASVAGLQKFKANLKDCLQPDCKLHTLLSYWLAAMDAYKEYLAKASKQTIYPPGSHMYMAVATKLSTQMHAAVPTLLREAQSPKAAAALRVWFPAKAQQPAKDHQTEQAQEGDKN